ncbi:hypothetical protein VM1G_06823 [Cytospora mali]|uniref:Uncharacterized protein n=1 Tax=Cytospora mali TaxID=578113 RepID=A0A194W4V5_CYTMA|nr:hypothetical protein VM1G_06823 [Valsa mali]
MTIHGPLTSMALGRSPYDDIVMGEGEGDIRAPLQMYDERARPVNPETRRINRDIIRSHNEVMQVIGVVEPEESKEEMVAERIRRIDHAQHDNFVGRRFNVHWRFCELIGVWGLGAIRQRVFLYEEYSHVPFWQPLHRDSGRPWAARLFWDGFPAFVAATALDLSFFVGRARNSTVLRWGSSYIQTMLRLWLVLRRANSLPPSASYLFPSWKFFVPFTDSSAIAPCPLPASLSLRSVASWLGRFALGVIPIAAFWSVNYLLHYLGYWLHEEIFEVLPHPTSLGQPIAPNHEIILQHAPTNAEDPALGQAPPGSIPLAHDVEAVPIRVQPAVSQGHTLGDGNVWEVPQSAEAPANTDADPDAITTDRSIIPPARPNGSARADGHRPSSRPQHPRHAEADEFTDDDEETEVVSATLISFDVENSPENIDPNDSNIPPGVWSAELRPNPGNDTQSVGTGRDGDSPRRPRLYRANELTQLPANLAARMFARHIVSLCFAPMEASALREVALLWCRSKGLSTASLWGPTWFWPFTFNSGGRRVGSAFGLWATKGTIMNFLGVEVIHLLLDFGIWTGMSLYSTRFVMSSAEWDRLDKERQEWRQQQEQLNVAARTASDSHAGLRTAPGTAGRNGNRPRNGPTR